MTDSELVSRIKRVLEDPEGIEPSELDDLARIYARRCRTVDAGLGRAAACLQSGMLCETDRLMRDEGLQNSFLTLMFDEAEDWQNVCRALGLDVPIAISRDATTSLFLFEVEYEGARDDLAAYRRLELEGAPARRRLSALAAVREKLPTYSDVFRAHTQKLEKEYDAELNALFAGINVETARQIDLEEIDEYLNSPGRVSPASDALRSYARMWRTKLANLDALEDLRRILANWRKAKSDADLLTWYRAYMQRDFSGARSVAQTAEIADLEQLIAKSQSAERRDDARIALSRKLDRLERLCAESNDADALAAAYEDAEISAEAAQIPIPADVRDEYERRLESILTHKRRRRTAIISFSGIAIAFFLFLITATAMKLRAERSATGAAAEVARLLDEYEASDKQPEFYSSLATAASLVDRNAQQHPEYMANDEYSTVEKRFRKLQEAETRRAENFASLSEEIAQSHEKGKSVPERVAALQKMTRTSDERAEANTLKRKDVELASVDSRKRVDSYKTELDAITADFTALRDDEDRPEAERAREARTLRERLDRLAGNEKFGIPAPLVNNRRELDLALAGFERWERLGAAVRRNAAELAATVGDAEKYEQTLRKMQNELSRDDENRELVDLAVDDLANVERARTWNRVLDDLGRPIRWCDSSANFRDVDDAFVKLGKQLAFAPEFDDAKKTAEDVRAFAEKGGATNAVSVLKDAVKQYSRPVWVLMDASANAWYYVTSKPSGNDVKRLKYLVNPDGIAKDFNVEFKGHVVANEAPPHTLYKQFKELSNTTESWYRGVADALAMLDSAPQEQLDPAFRAAIILKIARSTDGFPGFDPLTSWMRTQQKGLYADVNVYNPGAALKNERAAAILALHEKPSWKELSSATDKAFDRLNKPYGEKYVWAGYLDVVGGAPVVRFNDDLKPNGDATLWIARGREATASKLGSISGETVKFESDGDWTSYRWTPVYVRQTSESL